MDHPDAHQNRRAVDNSAAMTYPEGNSEWSWQPSLGSRTFVTEASYRPRPTQSAEPSLNEATHLVDENAPANGNPIVTSTSQSSSTGGLGMRKYSRAAESPRATKIHDESADEMVLRLSNEFTPIVDPNWDTVIYIGPPPQEYRQDNHEYEYIRQHFSTPYLMNSQMLKDINSTQLSRLLGPMSARSERKLKKLGIHQLIPQDRKPRYYIDLRPMQDEDEALLMITELTCSSGILSWHASHLASGVPKTLINGRDNLNITSKPFAGTWMEIDDSTINDLEGEEKDGKRKSSCEDRSGILSLEPEYSALRHYVAIERLLHAMAGHDPKLNSAAKVWTYFSISKYFDCLTHSKVSSWIYDWLFTSNNSNFIQANPEVAYRMAMGMRSPDILRTTFSMLVGERALMQAGRTSSESFILNPRTRRVSVHGRSTAHLDDDEINRLDHAAHSLTRRVTRFFNSLTVGHLDWATSTRTNDSELAKFEFLNANFPQNQCINDVWALLQDYVRGEIYQALSQNVSEGDLLRLYRTRGYREFGWLRRSQAFADAYNAMPLTQRILTQSFWSQLENYGLYQEREKVVAWTRSHSLHGLDDLAPGLDGAIDCIRKSNLCGAIEQMNSRISREKRWTDLSIRYQNRWWDLETNQVHYSDVSPDQGLSVNTEVTRALLALSEYETSAGEEGSTNLPLIGSTATMEQHSESNSDSGYLSYTPLAVLPANLLAQMSMEMRRRIMGEILTPGYASNEIGIESEISISQMDILLCLNEDEWKYLPLWAGGLDDGSGGVFAEEDVPDMVEGFRGGKMGLGTAGGGTGSVGGSFSMAGDSEDYDEVMTDEGVSTIGRASRIATDGTTSAGASTVMSLDE